VGVRDSGEKSALLVFCAMPCVATRRMFGCGAIVFGEGNRGRRRVFAGLPNPQKLEKKLKAAEGAPRKRRWPESFVADGRNVFRDHRRQFEEAGWAMFSKNPEI